MPAAAEELPQETSACRRRRAAAGDRTSAQCTLSVALGLSPVSAAPEEAAAAPAFGQTTATPAFGQTAAAPAFGQTNTFGTAQTQPSVGGAFGAANTATGGFGATQPATNFSFGTPAATGAATPGLFGSTMSPFGQQQVLGKRGKH